MIHGEPHAGGRAERTPATVLAGFLGAGRTARLNRILAGTQDRRCAALVNECGDAGIDGGIVVGAEAEVFKLNNGCVCCGVRGESLRLLGGLVERPARVGGSLLRSSGTARLLSAERGRHGDGIACVSLRFARPFERSRLLPWLHQLAAERGADVLRAKGIVDLVDAARRFVFRGVHMVLEAGLAAPWPSGAPRESRLVFIGRELDPAELHDGLALRQADP